MQYVLLNKFKGMIICIVVFVPESDIMKRRASLEREKVIAGVHRNLCQPAKVDFIL